MERVDVGLDAGVCCSDFYGRTVQVHLTRTKKVQTFSLVFLYGMFLFLHVFAML